MSFNNYEIIIADASHREHLFAEVWVDNEQLAEVFMENKKPIIEIYSHPNNKLWCFDYTVLQEIIIKIDDFLGSIGYPSDV